MNADFIVHFPGLGIHDLEVNRVAFRLFGFDIYWYGLLIAIAIVLCLFLASKEAPKFGLKSDHAVDAMIIIVPFMIIFARLYYVIFEWHRYADNWLKIFDTRDGGLAFYGGVIGGIIALIVMAKWRRYKVGNVLDFFVVYVPLGQAIGRWGNFFNQEAFGNNTDLPWGMISNGTMRYLSTVDMPGINPLAPVHPTFFYEFVANMMIFLILHRIRRQSNIKGETVAWYLVLYGAVRFFVESIRTDPLIIPNTTIRVSMLLSALMVLAGLAFLAVIQRRYRLALAAGELIEDAAEESEDAVEDADDAVEDTDAVAKDTDAAIEDTDAFVVDTTNAVVEESEMRGRV